MNPTHMKHTNRSRTDHSLHNTDIYTIYTEYMTKTEILEVVKKNILDPYSLTKLFFVL